MNNGEKIFQKSGAILKGHFLLASGLHSPTYWEKFQVLQSPNYTEKLCRMIATHFQKQNIQVVAGPTTGGIILAFETARQLGIRGIFAEKEGATERAFRRGFSINPGERVLIVDDIITTGNSIRQVTTAVTKQSGIVIGITTPNQMLILRNMLSIWKIRFGNYLPIMVKSIFSFLSHI